jgi:hypothetical protein
MRESAAKTAPGNHQQLTNTTFMVVIRRVPIGNNNDTSSNQILDLYTDIWGWEEQIRFLEQKCIPKEPYYLTAIYMCNLTQEE